MRSYTRFSHLHSKLQQLVTQATSLNFQILSSELEALLTEAELIKIYQPKFNSLLKDDKSALYIAISNESLPKILQLRKKQLPQEKSNHDYFGPFPSSFQVKQVLKIIRPIFRWCDHPEAKSSNGCFYYHLDLCTGICCNKVSKIEYLQTIEQIKIFLSGHSRKLVKQLKQEMSQLSKTQNFELAANKRDAIKAIVNITQTPYRLKPDPTPLQLSESPESNKLAYLRRLLHLHLGLPKEYSLERIEGYDVSNINGTNPAVGMVCFLDGQPSPDQYRLFNIRSLQTPNDFAMLREAIVRRQSYPEWGTPNLIIIDGGRGQLRAVLKVLDHPIPIIGIAKRPDRIILPTFSKSDKQPKKKNDKSLKFTTLNLSDDHPAMQLVQQIRNEVHRFSKKQHIRLRHKNAW